MNSATLHGTSPSGARKLRRKCPPSARSSIPPIMKTTRLTTSWPALPRKTVRTLQAARLRAYLRDIVLPFHPHYREVFAQHGLTWHSIRSLDDLAQIPSVPRPIWPGVLTR